MKIKIKILFSSIAVLMASNSAQAVNVTPTDPACVLWVKFTGADYTHLTNDDGIAYPMTQWAKTGGKCDGLLVNRSVSYKKFTKPTIEAKLKLPACPDNTAVSIWAVGTDGVSLPPITRTVMGECVTYPATSAVKEWPKKIKFYDRSVDAKAFKLKWYVSSNGQQHVVETTKHQVYITLEKPTTSRREETVFYLACNDNTDGHFQDNHTLVEAIYLKFQTKEIHPIDSTSGDENMATKLKFVWNTPGTVNDIMKDHQGVCGNWAQFFSDILGVHAVASKGHDLSSKGIPVTSGHVLIPGSKEWFVKAQVLNASLTNFNNEGFLNKGQGDGHWYQTWQGHKISSAHGYYYDPSYGLGPSATESALEGSGVSGYRYAYKGFMGSPKYKAWGYRSAVGSLLTFTPKK